MNECNAQHISTHQLCLKSLNKPYSFLTNGLRKQSYSLTKFIYQPVKVHIIVYINFMLKSFGHIFRFIVSIGLKLLFDYEIIDSLITISRCVNTIIQINEFK